MNAWGVQWVAGIKKTWGETLPSDFRKNLRNHGAPQARPREKARPVCEREAQLKISLRLRRALVTFQVCGVRSGWSEWRRVCVFPSSRQRADSAADFGSHRGPQLTLT